MEHEQDRRASCCDDIVRVKLDIYGNGGKGIKETLSDHEDYIQQQKGALSMLKWGMGFVGLGQIVLIVKAFLR